MDDTVAALVRDADRDRWLATLYAPAAVRPALLAVHALDLELAKVAATTTEAMIGQIRLAWWRERLQGLDRGELPAQPVLQALAAEVLPRGVTGEWLSGFEDAWLPLLGGATEGDIADHVAPRGRTVFGAIAELLGGNLKAGGDLGAVWAAGEAARADRDGNLAAPELARDAVLRPLLGLALLGRRDVARRARGLPLEPRATPGRQLVLLRAALIGR